MLWFTQPDNQPVIMQKNQINHINNAKNNQAISINYIKLLHNQIAISSYAESARVVIVSQRRGNLLEISI